jgi:hypothetical protein
VDSAQVPLGDTSGVSDDQNANPPP